MNRNVKTISTHADLFAELRQIEVSKERVAQLAAVEYDYLRYMTKNYMKAATLLMEAQEVIAGIKKPKDITKRISKFLEETKL